MRCVNCGANFDEGERECPFCGTPVKKENTYEEKKNGSVEVRVTDMNPLLDKEYTFSGNDILIRGRWGITVNVKVGDDRLYFETIPAKKNVLPAVMLEDIMAIENKFHMRMANIIIGIIGLVLGIAGGTWCFLLPILVILLYRERKIQIYLRNGNVLTIYEGSKANAELFIEDMKKITKIKQ